MSVEPTATSEIEFNHAGELALKLESLPYAERIALWAELSAEERADALPFLHDEIKEGLLERSSVAELQDIAETLDSGDIADVIELLADDVAQEVIDSLSEQAKGDVEESLSYPEDTVGRWLQRDALRFSPMRTVAQALSYIKKNGLPSYTDKLFLIRPGNQYLGAVSLSDVLKAESETKLKELPLYENESIFKAEMNVSEIAMEVRRSHFTSAAVVSDDNRFLGRITAEDAITTLQDEADHQLMSMAGLDEEDDLFAPVFRSAKRRAVWLGINLLTAFLASYVIGLFEDTVQQVVALAVLMPVVASMGGIAGSQTLTIVIRGLALEQLNTSNTRTLLIKEIGSGALNGLLWAVVVGIVAFFWFGDSALSVVIGVAILLNVLAAAVAGLFIPIILQKLKMDPALSGSVVLTTVTDVVGFMSFLGLASVFVI